MHDLVKIISSMKQYVEAMQRGLDNFTKALPEYTKQQIRTEAKRRLNSTREHYISHTKVKLTDYILVVKLDKDDWLTNALETGVGAFDMKNKMLQSPKVKISKKGHRYIHIPMPANKGAEKSTEKGQEFQRRINDVLSKPKIGLSRLKTMMSGEITETQQIMSDDPLLSGLYRTRTFDNAESYHSKKQRPAWQYVLFRTMSENPESMAKWEHPGIKPVNIMRAVDRWLDNNLEPLLESFIDAEVGKIKWK